MNLALGLAGVTVGLVASVVAVITLAVGLARGDARLLRQARPAAIVVLVSAVVAVGAMEVALLTDDFSISFVAEHHSRATPFPFDVATLWSALEGSILLWVLVLAGFTMLTAWTFRRRLTDPMVGWAMLTMFAVCVFFFGLLAGPANPFAAFDPPPGFDGPGPNPLLQNHVLMAFHPPMLYVGYVGFTVPFAFAIGALATGRVGEGWLLATRRWTLVAWGFLTAGIVLGAWWSYEVLGWGGYWAWDPVENASLLPWLTGTAYLHSVMVQERRGMLRVWNLSLVCATFALTILGTFITRSGVLESVHAFTESAIGPAILAFFALVVAVTVGLVAWRGDRLRSPGRIDSPLSREGAFLLNNVLFAAFAFTVLLGTTFPLVIEALQDERISVGTPFFNRMSTPLGLALLFLMAVAPVLPWRKASTELLRHRLVWPAAVGTATLVAATALGARGPAVQLAFLLGGFAAGSAGRQVVLAARRQGWHGLVGRANGGMIVHLGVVVVAVALAVSQSAVDQTELRLVEGEPASFAGHTFVLEGVVTEVASNRETTRALVTVDGDGPYGPGVSRFGFGAQQVGTPSVRVSVTEDVALSVLSLPDEPGGEVLVRITVQPMVVWLWTGGGIMVLGTLLAALPGSRRRGTEPVSAPVPGRTRRDGPRPGDDRPEDRPEVGVG